MSAYVSTPDQTHKITVQASTEHLSEVRDFIASYATKHGISSHEVEDIRLAVDEAYTNIIKHAYQNDPSQFVEIIMGSNENEFWVSLMDDGKSFDPTAYPEPDVRRKIKARERGGVGVFLMKKLMDRIEYYKHKNTNELRMIKKL